MHSDWSGTCLTCGAPLFAGQLHVCNNPLTGCESNASRYLGEIAEALREIGFAMIERNKLDQARFDKQYPVRPQPRDATVTYVKTPESEIKANQQGDDAEQSLDEWVKLKEANYLQEDETEGQGP